MKKSEMLAYKEKLQAIRSRLRGDVTAMAEIALRKSGIEGSDSNAMPIHMAVDYLLLFWLIPHANRNPRLGETTQVLWIVVLVPNGPVTVVVTWKFPAAE